MTNDSNLSEVGKKTLRNEINDVHHVSDDIHVGDSNHVPMLESINYSMKSMQVDCDKTRNDDKKDQRNATKTQETKICSVTENLETLSIACSSTVPSVASKSDDDGLIYESFESEEKHMDVIMHLIEKDLSEPYSIYTYRYFIHNWPQLCFLCRVDGEYAGTIVCKLDVHHSQKYGGQSEDGGSGGGMVINRGYIAMLAVDSKYRRRKIGSGLVKKVIKTMIELDADEIVLEAEITNQSALHLYQKLGFVRDKRLFRYYLNGVDALRLKLWLK